MNLLDVVRDLRALGAVAVSAKSSGNGTLSELAVTWAEPLPPVESKPARPPLENETDEDPLIYASA